MQSNQTEQTKPEEHIHAFLKSWLAWAQGEEGAGVYSPHQGLCGSLFDFLKERIRAEADYRSGWMHQRRAVRFLLHQRLELLYGDSEYPFGMEQYSKDCIAGTHHKLPAQLEFVREWLAELEEV